MAGLEKQREQYAAAVAGLADQERTRLVLVAHAQHTALEEVARTSAELEGVGLSHQYLVINGVLPNSETDDRLARSIAGREQRALTGLPTFLRGLPSD